MGNAITTRVRCLPILAGKRQSKADRSFAASDRRVNQDVSWGNFALQNCLEVLLCETSGREPSVVRDPANECTYVGRM